MIGPHVIGVGQAEIIIEAMLHRQKLFVMAQVPFAVTGGGIAFLFADLSQSHLTCVDAVGCLGAECAENAYAHIVTAGEQSRSRGAAHGLGYIKICELAAFPGHAVEMWRGVSLRAKGADVGVAHVVHEDDDDVG